MASALDASGHRQRAAAVGGDDASAARAPTSVSSLPLIPLASGSPSLTDGEQWLPLATVSSGVDSPSPCLAGVRAWCPSLTLTPFWLPFRCSYRARRGRRVFQQELGSRVSGDRPHDRQEVQGLGDGFFGVQRYLEANARRVADALWLPLGVGGTPPHPPAVELCSWPTPVTETRGTPYLITHIKAQLASLGVLFGAGHGAFAIFDARTKPKLTVKHDGVLLATGYLDASINLSSIHRRSKGAILVGFEFKVPGTGVEGALPQVVLQAVGLLQASAGRAEALVLLTDGRHDSQVVYVTGDKVAFSGLLTFQDGLQWVAAFLRRSVVVAGGPGAGVSSVAGSSGLSQGVEGEAAATRAAGDGLPVQTTAASAPGGGSEACAGEASGGVRAGPLGPADEAAQTALDLAASLSSAEELPVPPRVRVPAGDGMRTGSGRSRAPLRVAAQGCIGAGGSPRVLQLGAAEKVSLWLSAIRVHA